MTTPLRYQKTRFSLRTLLAAITFLSIACVALKFAGTVWWSILSGASLLLFMSVEVIAFTGRDKQRAHAIGFTVCVVIYGALLFLSRSNELDPYEGRLPTTKVLLPVFQSIATVKYVDMATGKEVPNYTPPRGGFGGGFGGGGMSSVSFSESPDRSQFMAIGHLLWALLFGSAGWFFAGFIDSRNRGCSTSSQAS